MRRPAATTRLFFHRPGQPQASLIAAATSHHRRTRPTVRRCRPPSSTRAGSLDPARSLAAVGLVHCCWISQLLLPATSPATCASTLLQRSHEHQSFSQEALQAGATELAGRDRHLRPAVPRVAEEGRSPEDEGRGRPARRAGRHPGRHRRRAGRHPVSGLQSSVWRSVDPEVAREAGGDAAIQDVDRGGDPRELHGVHRHRRQGRAGL